MFRTADDKAAAVIGVTPASFLLLLSFESDLSLSEFDSVKVLESLIDDEPPIRELKNSGGIMFSVLVFDVTLLAATDAIFHLYSNLFFVGYNRT